jgi:hypothetical protein
MGAPSSSPSASPTRLETLPLDVFGGPGNPGVTPSSGAVPFGFGITERGTIVVSEAGASTVSSYRLGFRGALNAITASLPVVGLDGSLTLVGTAPAAAGLTEAAAS